MIIEHQGVKGMKWGVRRIRSSKPIQRRSSSKTSEARIAKVLEVHSKVERSKLHPNKPFYDKISLKDNRAGALLPGGLNTGLLDRRALYTGKGYVKRAKKEYGGTSLKDIAAGEGVAISALGAKKAKAFSSNISNRGKR